MHQALPWKIELLKVPVAMGIIVMVMTLARKASMIQNGLFVNKPYKPVKYHYIKMVVAIIIIIIIIINNNNE